ncbi:MAG: protein disulfide isomerase family protein [Candidatus Paceibacterota bacterium]|jgi:hypothetical protein
MNKENKIILIVTILVIFSVILFAFVKNTNTVPNKYDEFAKCLTEKGAVMYGAEWCSHCKEQKVVFSDSFKFIKYVECPDNTKLCLDKGVTGYPTWIIGTSTKTVEGFDKDTTMKELSEATGCVLPQ